MILPARNDSWIVSAASRSYYASLLKAGVKLYEYQAGLLHAKTLVLDDTISLIGSANLDQRSFDLNYENNILFYGKQLATQIKQRQTEYLTQCQLINLEDVENWSTTRKIWNNTIAMLGPVL
jgi:cardiolipin synthase